MNLALSLVLLLGGALRPPAQGDSLGPGDHRFWVTVGSLRREYLVHVPARYQRGIPLPVVFMFHGSGGSLDEIASATGWQAKSDDEQFLAVFPNGFPNDEGMRVWNDGREGLDPRVRDVDFVQAMLDELGRRFQLDQKRIFVVGFSNGAGLAYRLALELNQRIASVAVVAGRLNVRAGRIDRPVPTLTIVGTRDGGLAADTAAVRLWASLLGCGGPAPAVRKGRYLQVRFQGCSRGADVTSYLVDEWAHYWPGGRNRGIGMWAENVIWRFFSKHPLSAGQRSGAGPAQR